MAYRLTMIDQRVPGKPKMVRKIYMSRQQLEVRAAWFQKFGHQVVLIESGQKGVFKPQEA